MYPFALQNSSLSRILFAFPPPPSPCVDCKHASQQKWLLGANKNADYSAAPSQSFLILPRSTNPVQAPRV